MLTDPLGDMLTRIRNGYSARKDTVSVPYSKVKEGVASVLVKEGYLDDIKTAKELAKKTLLLSLLYKDNHPKLNNIERISKPGVRVYTKAQNIPVIYGGMGLVILSTPKGVMSGGEAKKKGLGGEIICKVW